ncbi:hypothetical protein PV325_006271, partial [Microctonus aethiopoides]
MKPLTTKLVTLGIVGLFFSFSGIIMCFFWPHVFYKILSNELPLTPRSRIFEIWKDTNEIPMNMEFYFFNWTNPEELKIPGKKPNFIEVGPYTFKEKIEKVNIVFHPENNTVSFDQRKFWYFDPEKSNGKLSDKIVHLNVVAVSAAHKVRYWSYFMQNSLSFMLDKLSGIHIVKTVDELLFTGYEDPLITMGQMAVDDGEEIPPYDRFGWFYLRNGSTMFDGHYNMATGEDNLNNLGVMKNWNYKDTTSYYKTPCNVVEGSAGEFWPPNRDAEEITIWTADLCRPVTYEYTGTVMHKGILGYQYAIGEKTLGNSTKRHYPHDQAKYFERTTTTEDFFDAKHSTTESNENIDDPDTINMGQCYCNGECSPMGVINITACRYGAPGFVSLPHFYKADPILREQVTGMKPNETKHSFYITLEPNTGVPLDVAARFQINILVQPSLSVALFRDVPKIYFPIFWFNLKSGTTENLAWSLRQLLIVPSAGLYGSVILAIVGAIIVIIIAVAIYVRKGPKKLI